MTAVPQRQNVMALVAEAVDAGARQEQACAAIDLSERTLQRWQDDARTAVGDRRPARLQKPVNALSGLERERLLAVVNSKEFGHLPPSQIVPVLADRGEYLASESTIYRLLKRHGQLAPTRRKAIEAQGQTARAERDGTEPVVQLGYYLLAELGQGQLLLPVPVPVHGYF